MCLRPVKEPLYKMELYSQPFWEQRKCLLDQVGCCCIFSCLAAKPVIQIKPFKHFVVPDVGDIVLARVIMVNLRLDAPSTA